MTTDYRYMPRCNHDRDRVFYLSDKFGVYGSDSYGKPENGDFLIELAGGKFEETIITPKIPSNINMQWPVESLKILGDLHRRVDVPGISISWVDRGIPRLSRKDWIDIFNTIVELGRDKVIQAAHVRCIGGHGRTGTTLAILLGMSLEKIKKDSSNKNLVKMPIISVIRGWYCDSAVETSEQEEYVAHVLEREVKTLFNVKDFEEVKK